MVANRDLKQDVPYPTRIHSEPADPQNAICPPLSLTHLEITTPRGKGLFVDFSLAFSTISSMKLIGKLHTELEFWISASQADPRQSSIPGLLRKFADDTTIVGWISNSDYFARKWTILKSDPWRTIYCSEAAKSIGLLSLENKRRRRTASVEVR